MPLQDRWYMHDKDCKCPECKYHKQGTPLKSEATDTKPNLLEVLIPLILIIGEAILVLFAIK